MLGISDSWLAILLSEEGVHFWHRTERLDHCVTDDVGEGDLATAGALQVIVNDGSVVDH